MKTRAALVGVATATLLVSSLAQASFWGAALGAAAGGAWGGFGGAVVGAWFGNRVTQPRVEYVTQPEIVYERESSYSGSGTTSMNVTVDAGPSIEQMLPEIKAAVRASAYSGARQGTIDGMQYYFLRLQESELSELQGRNAAGFNATVPVLLAGLDLRKGAERAGYTCASFCGGFDENGRLAATVIYSHAADRTLAYSSLLAQCTDGRISFRDLRMTKAGSGEVFQKLVASRDETTCESPTETTIREALGQIAPQTAVASQATIVDTLDPKTVIPGWTAVHASAGVGAGARAIR